ncbi:unnamed protein product [Allacma fusca]|uniref:Uncharacterized protein n=1 Tax=Allacma fusca TaxID=39272 RepID=A0A8J2P2H5_9HEXA|nr:unnamed protein product [Allacma fusca]
MTATRASRPSQLVFILLLLLLSSSQASPDTHDSGAPLNSTPHNLTSSSSQPSSPDAWNIYLHKLSLFLPKQNESEEDSFNEIEEVSPIFDYVVNATSEDDFQMTGGHHPNQSMPSKGLHTVGGVSVVHGDLNTSLRFHCDGHDCPTAQLLQQKPSSSEQFSGEYRPKVLPQWKDRPRRVIRSSDEDGPEDPEGEDNGKLGPLRIFKYINHPDELVNTSEVSAVNSTEKDWGIVDSKEENQHRETEEKSAQIESSSEREATSTTERSLIPNSYFTRNSAEEKKLLANETTEIVINGTLDADGFRLRRSPFRPHWRDHRLYTHAREALYEIQAPSHLHAPPPGRTAGGMSMAPNSFSMSENMMPMQHNNLGMQQNSFGISQNNRQQNSFGVSPNSMQQNSFGVSQNNRQQNSFGVSQNNMQQNSFGVSQNNMQQNSFGVSQNNMPQNSFGVQQNSFGTQQNSAGMARPEYISMTSQPVQQQPGPLAAPVALPYTNNGIQKNVNQVADDRTFSTSATISDSQSPQEQSTFRFPKYQHPYSKKRPHHHEKRPGHGRRRPPQMQRPRGRPPGNGPVPSVMPPPQPPPLPRPRPQIQYAPSGRHPGSVRRPSSVNSFSQVPAPAPARPSPVNSYTSISASAPARPPQSNSFSPIQASSPARHPQTVPYSYPKHAANIQDILTFFKTEENDNEIPETEVKPSVGSSSLPPLNSGSGLSSEFRDIQTSLLKDIKDFAKRPSILRENEERSPTTIPIPPPRPSVLPLIDPEDPLDDIFSPKPKPVREMIRYSSRERETSTEVNNHAYAPSNQDYISSGKSTSGSKNRGRYEDDRRNSYYDDNGDDEKSHRNRHESSHASRGRDKNNLGRPEQHEQSKEDEEEDNYRSRHRDRHAPKNGHNHHHDRYEAHQDYKKQYQNFYKNYQDYKKSEDGYGSDERPYSDNLHRPSSNTYHRGRDESGDPDYDHRSHHYKKSPTKARRPHKAHRRRPHRRTRHKSRPHADSSASERYRSRYRDRETGSRERPMPQSSEFVPSPANKVKATMEQAYYQQRNRPIVIKRPYQAYRPIDVKKVEDQRKQQDQYWNTVGAVTQKDVKVNPPYVRPATIQKHYHYYGVNSPPVSVTPVSSNSLDGLNSQAPPISIHPSSTRRPLREGNISPEEDILEIHTGAGLGEVSTTPVYPVGGQHSMYPTDYDRSARLQKLYMEYLQRKLEAQAEAQTESMLPRSPTPVTSTVKPKRPMRMKIHIYPNEKVQVVDHNNNQNTYSLNQLNSHHSSHNQYNTQQNPIFNTHHVPHHQSNPQHQTIPHHQTNPHHQSNPQLQTVHHNTHSLFGHSHSNVYNPGTSGSANIHRSYGHYQTPAHSGAPTAIHTSGPVGSSHARPPGSSVDKNKNLVLHLHVHRRNDESLDGHMDMAGSETVTSTVKPLTYEDIYQASNSENIQMSEKSGNNDEQDETDTLDENQKKPEGDKQNEEIMESDKSLSMELPIHQDKIEDVLSTLLKLRD